MAWDNEQLNRCEVEVAKGDLVWSQTFEPAGPAWLAGAYRAAAVGLVALLLVAGVLVTRPGVSDQPEGTFAMGPRAEADPLERAQESPAPTGAEPVGVPTSLPTDRSDQTVPAATPPEPAGLPGTTAAPPEESPPPGEAPAEDAPADAPPPDDPPAPPATAAPATSTSTVGPVTTVGTPPPTVGPSTSTTAPQASDPPPRSQPDDPESPPTTRLAVGDLVGMSVGDGVGAELALGEGTGLSAAVGEEAGPPLRLGVDLFGVHIGLGG
jgi:hypothetical protein